MAVPRSYVISALVFQEGDWIVAQCLEYDLATQVRDVKDLAYEFQRLIFGHIETRRHLGLEPFKDLPKAPQKYWDLWNRSKIDYPTDPLTFTAKKPPVKVRPKLRVASTASAAA